MSALTGRRVLVTRPRAQAAALCAAIEAAGGEAVLFPLLEIVPLLRDEACERALDALPDARLAIFISPNAVDFGVAAALARGPWPAGLPVAAVGQGSARALRERGFSSVVVPADGFDSEALLACPALSAGALSGAKVLLFKGEGGRDLLAQTLAERGATVLPAPVYRRLPPEGDFGDVLAMADDGRLDGVVLSSSEAVRHFGTLIPPTQRAFLEVTPMFCSHPRIADAARVIGCRRIVIAEPGDAGILAALSTYNWPST